MTHRMSDAEFLRPILAMFAAVVLLPCIQGNGLDEVSPATEVGDSTGHQVGSNRQLRVVLGQARDLAWDRCVLNDGVTLTGRIVHESFLLQTIHGEVRLPRPVLAALDLRQQRQGTDRVITVTGDRLTGIMSQPAFEIQTTDAQAPTVVRRERVSAILFAVAEAEAVNAKPELLVQFHNGDFLAGTIIPNQLELRVGTDQSRTVELTSVAGLTFPDVPGGFVRVDVAQGDSWEGIFPPGDFRLRFVDGLELKIYSDRVASIRPWNGLPRHLAQAIGAPSTHASRPEWQSPMTMPGLVWIPGGEFEMGSPSDEKDRDLDEGPLTRVEIHRGFWMGEYEVTQLAYEKIMGRNPSQYLGDAQHPVERVNWLDAMDYCRALNTRERAEGRLPEGYAYRLPTEAEWEYACRAGTSTRFSHGDDHGYLVTPDFAWCGFNSGSSTHPVGSRKPNPWGLYDMHGNVWEWCLDEWSGAYPGGTRNNTMVTPQGSLRVARGGSWLYEPRFCRSANRDSYGILNRCSDVGFRVVLAPVE